MAPTPLFYACAVLSLTAALLGLLALGDVGQWVVSFPRSFTYGVFRVRFPLMAVGLAGFAAALFLGLSQQTVPGWALAPYAAAFALPFFAGFLAPTYVMFRTQQHSARYVPAAEAAGHLPSDAEVLAVEIGGDARAFPSLWMLQPHVAGDTVGGEPLVMTYCGLSHLGMAYRGELGGAPVDLKVMTQLENNLVLFDSTTQEPIEQIYGRGATGGLRMEPLPAAMMPLASFQRLYPQGLVFFNPPRSVVDRQVRKMMQGQLFGKGGLHDPANPRPVFPTLRHTDPRLPPKEEIYGVDLGGQAVAFTLGHLSRQGDSVTESIGGTAITVKNFREFGFVDVFEGEVRDVDARGLLPGGGRAKRVPHASRVLWLIWVNFYSETEVRL